MVRLKFQALDNREVQLLAPDLTSLFREVKGEK